MSITNNNELMTSLQLKNKLKTIDADKSAIKKSLLNVIEESQCLDNIAKSIGLIKNDFSFINRVSWENVLIDLEKMSKSEFESTKVKEVCDISRQSSDQLKNELIPQLQKWRNNWMYEVILIEFVFLSLLSLVVAGVTHLQGLWTLSNISISFQPFLYERPVFSLIMGTFLLVSFSLLHFSIRNFVAKQLIRKLKKKSSEFDLAGAFKRNTRIQHSIFRPDIIGWGWLKRKCLLKNSH